MRAVKLTLATLFVCLLTASARADTVVVPINLTSGTAVLTRTGQTFPASFSFANADNSFSFSVNANPFANSPINRCPVGCAPGSTVDLSFLASGFDFTGSATYNGVNYIAVGIPFRINAGSVTLPSDGSGAVFVVPFTFGGAIGLFETQNQVLNGAPNFSLQLSGTGEALARFVSTYNGFSFALSPQTVVYQAPVLTPEPATVTLLVIGLAGVGAAARIRKRRKTHNTEA